MPLASVAVRAAAPRLAPLLALLLVLAHAAAAQSSGQPPAARGSAAPHCEPERVALVLPGGGVRGLAHVGTLYALDSLGIVPDLVVGTSMGAIVGALYASGYSAREVDSLAQVYDVAAAVGRYVPRVPRALSTTPPTVVWEEGQRGPVVQTSIANEEHVNLLMTALLLRGNLTAAGDFDSLPIPFRAVAARLASGERRVLDGGDLAEAVRASFAIPIVFRPIVLGGDTLVDGGVAENVPIRAARDAGATRVLLSRLLGGGPPPDLAAPTAVGAHMIELLFDQETPPLAPRDLVVEIDVHDVGALDFSPTTVRLMIDRGREAGLKLAADPCLRRARRARATRPLAARFAPDTLGPLGRDILRELARGTPDRRPRDVPTTQERLRALADRGSVRALWLNPALRRDSLVFTPVIEPAPALLVGLGIAYDHDVGGRLWFGGISRRLAGRMLAGVARGELGNFEQALRLQLRPSYRAQRAFTEPFASVLLAHELVRTFRDDGAPRAAGELPEYRYAHLRAGIERVSGASSVEGALVSRWWTEERPAHDTRAAAGAALRVDLVPVPAPRTRVQLDALLLQRFVRVELDLRHATPERRFRVLSSLLAGYGTDELPLYDRFPIGGAAGFPGLHIGEGLALAQAAGTVEARWRVAGPFSVAVAPAAAWAEDLEDASVPGGWLAGVRAGAEVESPIGPVRVLHGWNTQGRRLWFVRVGYWF